MNSSRFFSPDCLRLLGWGLVFVVVIPAPHSLNSENRVLVGLWGVMHDLLGNALTAKTEPLGLPYMGSKRKYAELDAFFAGLPCVAFMSEYNAPFHCIHEIKTRSTLSSSSNTCHKIERLYVNRRT